MKKYLISYAYSRFGLFPRIKDTHITEFQLHAAPYTELWTDEIRGILFSKEKTNCAIIAITEITS